MLKVWKFIKKLRERFGKWFWVILIITLLIVWRVVAGANKSVKIQTVKATKGDLVQSVSTSGEVKADQYSQLTFPTGGKIASVWVRAGDKVKKGQTIVALDTVPLVAAYQQALNNYRNYQAAAQNVLDQVKDHSADESFAQKATRTAAEVARDNAYDSVKAAQDNLSNAIIYAPFSGIIDTVSPSSPGINVLPGAANYTIVNPDSVYFDAEVEETDLPNVNVGQKVNLKLDAYPNDSYQGIVQTMGMVAFTSSTGGNAYHVRISLPKNDGMKFKVGMGGDVDIIYNTISNPIKVPSSAVVTDSTNYVWLDNNGRAKKVNVDVGGSNADETEIKSGIKEGDTVISNPPANLIDGQKVSI